MTFIIGLGMQVLAETAELKRAEALELASQWAELKKGAEEARRRQQMIWQEARAFGDALNGDKDQGLDQHMREPTVASELTNGQGQVCAFPQNNALPLSCTLSFTARWRLCLRCFRLHLGEGHHLLALATAKVDECVCLAAMYPSKGDDSQH